MNRSIKKLPAPAVRGAGRCPKCGSHRVARASWETERAGGFYSRLLEVCGNPACKAVWEPFNPGDLLDAGDPTSSFKEPCENCAFRPGSHEQKDLEEWVKMVEQLKHDGRFYCHKGVPISPESEDGFLYPHDRQGNKVTSKMRMCRGWLRMWGAQMDKGLKSV